MALGFSYQPGSMDHIPVNQSNGPAVGGVSPQGAAKILSLRIPRNVGPQAISPYALLTSHGAQGAPDLNAMIAALMRTVQPPMGGGGREPQGGGPSFMGGMGGPLTGAGTAFPGVSGATPAPRIIPGSEDADRNFVPKIPEAPPTYEPREFANPYLDPRNFAPAPFPMPSPTIYTPQNPEPGIDYSNYHFGSTPPAPAVNPLQNKFDSLF